MTTAHRPRAGRRTALPALALLAGLVAAGCSGEQAPVPPGAESSESLLEPSKAPTLSIEPVTELGRVTGRLSRKDRRRVQHNISGVAVRWLDAAYVEGRYPRNRFGQSLSGFATGTRAVARRDLRVLSNKAIGARVAQVTPTRMHVRADLLAVDRRAVGATAHVLTTFETAGRLERRVRVSGRLMMTRSDGRWKVFAYHVNRGVK